MTTVVARLEEGGRRIEEVATRGLSHRTKIEILAALHEGPASTTQLARILRQDAAKVWHHIQALLKDGSIEEAFSTEERNHTITYYRQIEVGFISGEDAAKMSAEDKQITAALILQAAQAEALAALWAGKLHSDPLVWMAWEPIVLSERGRGELAEEQQRNWDAMKEIAAEDVNHRARTGEDGRKVIVATFGYERARSDPHTRTSDDPGAPPSDD